MKTIDTLVPDIQALLEQGFVGSDEWASIVGQDLAKEVQAKLAEDRTGAAYLRPSNLGNKCNRQLWYGMNQPETAEKLPADAKMKFLFGNILETTLLALAEVSGHIVTAQQKEVSLFGVTGHIDAIIDGSLVDVKSASSIAFQKFAEGLTPEKDSFNYLTQLGFYLEALQADDELTDKDRAAFLVVDKTLGKLCLDVHVRQNKDWEKIINDKREALKGGLPRQGFWPVPDGKSGNLKLGTECSYCPFKHDCWPGLRVFLYASGPRFLTHVARQPDVNEV